MIKNILIASVLLACTNVVMGMEPQKEPTLGARKAVLEGQLRLNGCYNQKNSQKEPCQSLFAQLKNLRVALGRSREGRFLGLEKR